MSEHEEAVRLAGRATELAQLDRLLREIREGRDGRGRAVFLSGAVGIGKTALARGFMQNVKRRDPEAVLLGSVCVEEQSAYRPYGPFRDLLAQLSGLIDDEALAATVRREVPGWLAGASPAAGRHALFDQLLALCRAIARRRTLVLFIDDLHWSDLSSLDLLARLGSGLGSIPLLLLVTSEQAPSVNAGPLKAVRHKIGPNLLDLALTELQRDAITVLAETLVGGPLAKDAMEWLAEAAQGSPLRAEQLLRLLMEREALRKRLFRHSLRAGQLPNKTIDIENAIVERVDALEPNLRWTLEAATLAGSVIDSTVVAWQVGRGSEEAVVQLRLAEEAYGLIAQVGGRHWSTGSSSLRYRFSHPLIRRVLRKRVSGRRRGHLLRRAAETLEQLAGDGASEIADEIASLYVMTDSRGKAHEWSLKAADLAERLYAVYEADQYLRVGARTTRNEVERLQIKNRLARLYAATGREPEAEALLEAINEKAAEIGERAMELGSGTMLAWLQLERGAAPFEVSALAGRMVDVARRAEMPQELVAALDLSCVVAERIGRAEEALLMAEEALYVAEQSGDVETVAQAAYRLARVHVSWGSPEDGRALAQRALEVFGQVDELGGVAVCHDLLGLANFRAGDWDGAVHHWESALESMEVAGVPDQRIAMQVNIAELLTLRGEFDRARRLFETGLREAEELDDASLARRCRVGIARLEFERGDYAMVLELTEEIRGLLPESGAWRENFQTTAIRALAYLELGDELQAWQEASQLEQLYQGKEGWFERRAEGDAVRIRVIDLDSDAWLAGVVAQQGIGETTEKDPYGEGFLQYHQAQVFARAKPGEARTSAERAVELFEKLGAIPMLERARQLLTILPTADDLADRPKGGSSDEEKIDKWFESLEG